MALWFTSDQHYGHRNIINLSGRPFGSVEEMNEELITRHNSVVRPGDEVFHLGDFSLDDRLVRDILPRLSGSHFLIVGNHDRCHPCHKKHEAATRKYLRLGFRDVLLSAHVGWFLLSHFPYVGDSKHEARYPEWRPKDNGDWLLHGHVHEVWKVRGRMINVGVDQWNFTPVRLEELERLRSESLA